MGIVAFLWGENKLTLVQNRETSDSWATEPAIWDEHHKILRSQPDNNLGTWFGISKKGKVVFLVEPSFCNYLSLSVLHPIDFLRGEMTPRDYTRKMSQTINNGLFYEIIVADIKSNSMYYIAKKRKEEYVAYKEVGFGVHTLSSGLGLDSNSPKALHMKDLFNEIVANKQVPTVKEMAEKFVDKTVASCFLEKFGVEDIYSTMSTIALEVKPTKQVMFYERHLNLENGKWEEHHDFTFKIQ